MAAYKDLIGQKITKVTSNPSEPKTGQMWYNPTTQSLKALGIIEAMTSGTSMSNTRGQNGTAHNGTQNAALSVAGNNQGGPLVNNNSEEYNGSGWTSGGTYPISSFGTYGSGVQTAALFSGGRTGSPPFPVTNTSASYNGTSFGAEGNLNQARQSAGCFGATENASIAAGGHNAPGNYTDTEEYNGSAWTTVPATFPSQDNMGAAGVQTAGIANTQGGTGTFLFDGSTWTGGPSMNTARSSLNQAMMGLTQDAVVALGANPSANNAIENYDGTSWTTSPATLGTGRAQSASSGSNTAGVLFGGTTTAYVASTEEYNKSTNAFTAAAWASGGNLNTARDEGASSQNGLQTAALYFGGYASDPSSNATEQYNGTSWTSKNNLNTARYSGAGAGTTTAALYSGGFSNPSTLQSAVEEFDGTNWATQPNSLSTARVNCGGCGLQTAALVFGGVTPSPGASVTNTEEYDGSSWTNGGAMPVGRSHFAGAGVGIQTAALAAGGNTAAPATYTNSSVEYGGESWTAGGTLVTGANNGGGAGTLTDAIIFGGSTAPGAPNYSVLTQGYDGTAFSTRPSMATARVYVSGTGTAAAGLAFGGNTPPYTAATEEFTGETGTANIATFSVS